MSQNFFVRDLKRRGSSQCLRKSCSRNKFKSPNIQESICISRKGSSKSFKKFDSLDYHSRSSKKNSVKHSMFENDSLLNNISQYLTDQGMNLDNLRKESINISIAQKENEPPLNSSDAEEHRIWIENYSTHQDKHSVKPPKYDSSKTRSHQKGKKSTKRRKLSKQFKKIKAQMIKTLSVHQPSVPLSPEKLPLDQKTQFYEQKRADTLKFNPQMSYQVNETLNN